MFTGLVWVDGSEPAKGTPVQPGFHSLDLSTTTGRIFGCPSANKWAIAAWWGADDTAIGDALATCGDASIAAAYSLDPETDTFLRYVAGRPDVSTLEGVDWGDGIIVLASASAVPPPPPPHTIWDPPLLANCPAAGKWAISVSASPSPADAGGMFATCENVAIAAAYALDPGTQTWSRYIAGRPDLTTLTSLDVMEGVLTLGAQTAQ